VEIPFTNSLINSQNIDPIWIFTQFQNRKKEEEKDKKLQCENIAYQIILGSPKIA